MRSIILHAVRIAINDRLFMQRQTNELLERNTKQASGGRVGIADRAMKDFGQQDALGDLVENRVEAATLSLDCCVQTIVSKSSGHMRTDNIQGSDLWPL